MKSEIFIFFVFGFCFNIVAPYHKYAGFQQGVYQPQNYPPNPSPVYPAPRSAVINYEPPQQVVNYEPSPSESKYVIEQDTSLQYRKPEEELQEAIQQKVIEKQSDAIFEEQPPSQIYPERPSLYIAPALPERNYNTYGQAYSDIYPTQGPRHWGPRNAYQPSLPVQKPFIEGAVIAYPQWQSRAYKAIPRQNEYYGDPYVRQNVFDKPGQYISQPRHAKLAETLSGPETKTQSAQPQYEHNGSSFERHNTYKTPVQYIEQIKAEEVLKREVVKQKNEFLQNPYEHKASHNVPVRYAAHQHQAKPIEAPPVSETKNQPTIIQQQETEYYGSPYERTYVQNVPMQYEDEPLQAKPVEVSSVSETKIQPVQPKKENHESPYQQKTASDVLVQYVAESQQAKPVEVLSASETNIQPVKQDEYYDSPYKQKYMQNVPMQYKEEPQQAKPVEVSTVLETNIQPVRQDEYYESPYEQKNVRDVPVQYVAELQQTKPAEALSGSEIKIQPGQDKILYDSLDEISNTSNIPEQFTTQPQKAQPEVQSPLGAETITLEKLANRPEVIDFLASTSKKRRYLIFHQNGTVEHVDSIDDSLLGNSHYFKSNDLRLGTMKHKEIPLENKTSPTMSTPYIENTNRTPNKLYNNVRSVPHRRPILKEINPTLLPTIEDNIKTNYIPNQIHNKNYTAASTILPKHVVNNNYHPISVIKPNLTETYKNKPKNYTLPWTTLNKHLPAKDESKIDVTFKVNDTNVINVTDAWRNNLNNNSYKLLTPNLAQPNSELNYYSSSTEVVGLNIYRSPTNRVHRLPVSEKDNNNYYHPEHKNANNPSRIQNNYDDVNKPPIEYVATPAAYYANEADAFSSFVEPATTALPFESKNIKNKSDIMNTYPEIEPPKILNILDSFAKKAIQETNNDTSSNVKNQPGNANPSTGELKNVTTEASVLILKNNTNNEYYTNVTDADNNNDRTVNETTSSTTDMQDTNIESDNDDNNDRFSIEANTEYINNTQITAEDETPLSPAEDTTTLFPADDKTTLSRVEPLTTEIATDARDENAEEEKQQMEDVILIEDLTTENQLGENEVVVDEAFWDAVYSANDTGGFNELFIFNIKVDEPVIEKNSRSYVLANGTHVEETEEIIWEHKSDAVPRETKYTKITKNYDPESISSAQTKSKSPKDAKTSKCKHHKT